MSRSSRVGAAAPPWVAVLLDTALVVVFVAIGRRSHDEDAALLGFLVTLWPFLVGALAGWLVAAALRRPLAAVVPSGLVVWGASVLLGMVLRVLSGQGVQPSFVLVTAVVLGVFLVGWRAVASLVQRLRGRRSAA
ncbi:DUF3054 domain-containing protein [Herbiconiux moechotypicola]|uniref:DUF3054 domain-containing protein n=1 Tax=Herbiconiux moechotypicola TaxID=637393 RepID=UPI00217EC8C8|nr:DUF3054 domain-containing protein [Herbiconiux moechotypicola]MCS5729109.1 DUF3054 domain-containing protein [Herbiconiux moechotypicola]